MDLETAFFELHADMPRQGAGSDWCTQEAISRLPPLRKPTAILDLGCGSGRQTVLLAKRFLSPVTAVDSRQPFLDELVISSRIAGIEEWITPRCCDILDLDDQPGSYDLIWCEGGVRLHGWERSLRSWAPLLRPRGVIAVSDCTWLERSCPPPAKEFWEKNYPSMGDIEGNIATAERAGLKMFEHFVLPRSAWWDSYYGPLSRRVRGLSAQADPTLAEVIASVREEIAMFERYGDYFGYVFYLMRLN